MSSVDLHNARADMKGSFRGGTGQKRPAGETSTRPATDFNTLRPEALNGVVIERINCGFLDLVVISEMSRKFGGYVAVTATGIPEFAGCSDTSAGFTRLTT